MDYRRMPIEIESPEQLGYGTIAHNLSESSVADLSLADLDLDLGDLADRLLCYGDHLGDPRLRSLVGADWGVDDDAVLVTPGAAPALFCVATALLGPGDHAVIAATNYATNLETPRAIGAAVDRLELRFEDAYRLDLDRLVALIRPGVTKLVSLTYPHNPTGTTITADELDALVAIVEDTGCVLLLDETYRDLTRGEALPVAAACSTRAISVSSMSKAYGLPGLRIGWLACEDPALAETLLAAKEQILICGATLDEAIAAEVLDRREPLLAAIRTRVADHLDLVTAWVAGEERIEWVPPTGGVVAFPRIRAEVAAELHVDAFYRSLLADHGTYVGPGHWFDEDRRHFRLGFGWPTTEDLQAGLAGISGALEAAAR